MTQCLIHRKKRNNRCLLKKCMPLRANELSRFTFNEGCSKCDCVSVWHAARLYQRGKLLEETVGRFQWLCIVYRAHSKASVLVDGVGWGGDSAFTDSCMYLLAGSGVFYWILCRQSDSILSSSAGAAA